MNYRSFDPLEDAFMTSLEGKRRGEIFFHRNQHPEERPAVEIDHHGLIWSDGKVMANLFQCSHHLRRVECWMAKKENRASINTTCGIKS